MQDQAMNALEQSICPPCRAPPPLRLCEFGIYDATDGAPTTGGGMYRLTISGVARKSLSELVLILKNV